MAQITLNIPALPANSKTTLAGLYTAGAYLLKHYQETGGVSWQAGAVSLGLVLFAYLTKDGSAPVTVAAPVVPPGDPATPAA